MTMIMMNQLIMLFQKLLLFFLLISKAAFYICLAILYAKVIIV